jgi:hypothetical protein
MKRIILVLLFFSSFSCYSQSVQDLKDIIAYFLEVDDSLQIYKRIDVKKDSLLANQDERIKTDSLLVESYKSDVTEYVHIIIAKDKQLSNKNEEINLIKDKSKEDKKKLWVWVLGLGAGDVLLVALIIVLL